MDENFFGRRGTIDDSILRVMHDNGLRLASADETGFWFYEFNADQKFVVVWAIEAGAKEV